MDYFSPKLLAEIRDQFAFVEECPFVGERIFFENAGGALTLKSVVETSSKFAAIPDNQGRENAASKALMEIIQEAKLDAAKLFGATAGQFFVGSKTITFEISDFILLAASVSIMPNWPPPIIPSILPIMKKNTSITNSFGKIETIKNAICIQNIWLKKAMLGL